MLSSSKNCQVSSARVCARAGIAMMHGSRPCTCSSRTRQPNFVPTAPRGRSLVSTAATYHLGPVVYPSKGQAREFFKHMLKQHKPRGTPQPGQSVPGKEIHPGHKDFEAIWYLWHHHPDAGHPRFADNPITHFSVKKYIAEDSGFQKPKYCVHFANPFTAPDEVVCSREGPYPCIFPFSYHECLDNKQHNQITKNGGWAGPVAPRTAAELAMANKTAAAFADVLQAQQLQHMLVHKQLMPDTWYHEEMRDAIAAHIHAFKQRFFESDYWEFACPINGSRVYIKWDCQVGHHDPPLAVLVEQWLQQEGMMLADVAAWTETQKSSWVRYHHKHANLRMVSKRGNLFKAATDKKAVAAVRRRRRTALPGQS